MKRALFDLNVLLDVLLDRAPHAETSAALWRAVEERRLEGLVAAHGFPTLFYLVAKARDTATARRVVDDLLSVFGVAPIDATTLRRASDLQLTDFEDAVGAAAAEACGCDAIVTRDPRGFTGSPVEAIDPTLALAALAGEVHESTAAYAATTRRGRSRTRSALLLTLVTALSPISLSSANESIVWGDDGHLEAVFIPEGVLHEIDPAAPPHSKELLSDLARRISSVRDRWNGIEPCRELDAKTSLRQGADVVELARAGPLAHVVRVAAKTVGWMRGWGVTTLVEFEVDESLILEEPAPTRLSALVQGGYLLIDGIRLCDLGSNDLYSEGDRLLLISEWNYRSEGVLYPTAKFRIDGDLILSRGSRRVVDTRELTLEELRRALSN